jgi:carbon monoxide dehydrogenase subunit G
MEMQGNRLLAITQQQAWDALNDPEVLKTCIAGCDKVERTAENEFTFPSKLGRWRPSSAARFHWRTCCPRKATP